MKRHTRIYMNHFQYGIHDFIPCELLGVRSNDVHHIDSRGMGGSSNSDNILNLMALERDVHVLYGDKSSHLEFLNKAHQHFILTSQPFIKFNPFHSSFDLLINTNYGQLLHDIRLEHNELKKYLI